METAPVTSEQGQDDATATVVDNLTKETMRRNLRRWKSCDERSVQEAATAAPMSLAAMRMAMSASTHPTYTAAVATATTAPPLVRPPRSVVGGGRVPVRRSKSADWTETRAVDTSTTATTGSNMTMPSPRRGRRPIAVPPCGADLAFVSGCDVAAAAKQGHSVRQRRLKQQSQSQHPWHAVPSSTSVIIDMAELQLTYSSGSKDENKEQGVDDDDSTVEVLPVCDASVDEPLPTTTTRVRAYSLVEV